MLKKAHKFHLQKAASIKKLIKNIGANIQRDSDSNDSHPDSDYEAI